MMMDHDGPRGKASVLDQDWNGGAGNGLGTLYAFVKVRKKKHVAFSYFPHLRYSK